VARPWNGWRLRAAGEAAQTEAALAKGDVGYHHAVVMARAAKHVGAAAVRKEEARC